MLVPTSPADGKTWLSLQDETDHAAFSQDVASCRTRLLWSGLGLAVCTLIGFSAFPLDPLAWHAFAESSRRVPDLAFNPMPALNPGGIRPASHLRSDDARSSASRPAPPLHPTRRALIAGAAAASIARPDSASGSIVPILYSLGDGDLKVGAKRLGRAGGGLGRLGSEGLEGLQDSLRSIADRRTLEIKLGYLEQYVGKNESTLPRDVLVDASAIIFLTRTKMEGLGDEDPNVYVLDRLLSKLDTFMEETLGLQTMTLVQPSPDFQVYNKVN